VLCCVEATRWTGKWRTFAADKAGAYVEDQLPSTHPIAADIPDVQAVEVNFDGVTYVKGASVVRQLAAYVGIEPFLRAMQVYLRRHEYGNTTLADLLAVLADESGRDLSRWSAQWLETAGVNTLRVEAEVDAAGRYTSVALLQAAAPDGGVLRDHRVALGLYRAHGDELVRAGRVELDVRGERTEVPELLGVVQPDLLLVNDDDLGYCRIALDARSLATATTRLGDIEDPLARMLVADAAWDMTLDGKLATRDYVTLALRGAGAESDLGVVRSAQRRLCEALTRYADPSWTADGWARLTVVAEEQMRAAEPGSDLQLAWARTLAAAAATRSAEHATLLRGLLDGSGTVPGLTVDAELRWTMLCALVAIGAAGDTEIDAELERDPTASGQRRAATARALRPTVEAKTEAWRLITEDDELPTAITEAIIAGFQHPAQTVLTEPYAQRYFAAVRRVWERRTSETARAVVVGLFPDAISEQVVDLAEAFLTGPRLPPALRRLVAEQQDRTRRALRVRQRDAAAVTAPV
jgi:aminopeptidase N